MADFVREIMTPGVVVVPPDASLVEAAQLMRAQGIGDVLVASERHVLGVLTDRDITLRAVADGADPLTVSARAVCTPNPVVVGPGDEVSVAAGLMREHAVRRLPVVEDGRLVGMVSLGDVAIAQDPQSTLAEVSRADGHGRRRDVGRPRRGGRLAEPQDRGW
jgi:CBS domain-containing protein